MLKILKNIRNSLLILILLTANTFARDIRLPKDVGSGNTYSKSLGSGFKKHGYTIVSKKDGHPVRAGGKSIRFEVRFGDCGKDCLLYTSPSPRDATLSRMPSSA